LQNICLFALFWTKPIDLRTLLGGFLVSLKLNKNQNVWFWMAYTLDRMAWIHWWCVQLIALNVWN